jgi:hypothetical protein
MIILDLYVVRAIFVPTEHDSKLVVDPLSSIRHGAYRSLFVRWTSSVQAKTYVYDFGDHWEHVVEIESEEKAQYRKQYPICIDGAEPCPREDCGGPPGYKELLAKSPGYPREFHPQDATWTMRDVQRGFI